MDEIARLRQEEQRISMKYANRLKAHIEVKGEIYKGKPENTLQ